jgi:hypothetical protein
MAGNSPIQPELSAQAIANKKTEPLTLHCFFSWGIYASRSFVERHGRPSTPADINGFSIVELVDEIETLPAARWIKTYAPTATVAALARVVDHRDLTPPPLPVR